MFNFLEKKKNYSYSKLDMILISNVRLLGYLRLYILSGLAIYR